MICGTFTLRNVPEEELASTISGFKATDPPPNDVTSEADGPGTFTVKAIFPPCPPELIHTTDS